MVSQRHFDVVGAELQNGSVKPGLWTRAVAETGSEGSEARARYINLRVAELVETEEILAERQRNLATSKNQRSAAVFFTNVCVLAAIGWVVIGVIGAFGSGKAPAIGFAYAVGFAILAFICRRLAR